MSSNSPFVFPPSAEERAELAEQLQRIDEARAANARVPAVGPNDRFVGDLSQGSPQSLALRSGDVDDVPIPAPSTVTFYAKHSSLPRSGASVGPEDIVELNIPGMGRTKTSVANALNMGLITRDLAGGYRGINPSEHNGMEATAQRDQAQNLAQEAAELAALREVGDARDANTEQLLGAVVQAVPGEAIHQLVLDVVQNDGTISEAAVVRAAQAAGWSGDQGRQVVERLYTGMSRQAVAAVVSQGVPQGLVDDAYAWMAQTAPVEHKHATLNLVLNSDATELKRLAKQYYLHRVVRQDT